ncbi:MAG: MAPEG family protein, partial [Myxococcota bacterium]
MTSTLLFWPVLLQILLTTSIYVRLLVVKRRAFATGEVDRKRVSIDPSAWPDSVIVVNNNLLNQFQVPVLFYVVSIVLVQLDAGGIVALGAAWVFVLSRAAHAFVHMSSNYVPYRLRLFSLGLLM